MRPLIIGRPELAAIAKVRAFGEAHPFSKAALEKRLELGSPAVGDDPRRRLVVRPYFIVAFSVGEYLERGDGAVWARRLAFCNAGRVFPWSRSSSPLVRPLLRLFGVEEEPDLLPKAVEICRGLVVLNLFAPIAEAPVPCR